MIQKPWKTSGSAKFPFFFIFLMAKSFQRRQCTTVDQACLKRGHTFPNSFHPRILFWEYFWGCGLYKGTAKCLWKMESMVNLFLCKENKIHAFQGTSWSSWEIHIMKKTIYAFQNVFLHQNELIIPLSANFLTHVLRDSRGFFNTGNK